MFHFVTLFTVAAEAEDDFVRDLRDGGAWHKQARRLAPTLVAADLLRHQSRPLFLCHDIWTTREAYSSACRSEAVRQLLDARKHMAADHFEIGAFTFPHLGETSWTTDADPALTGSLNVIGSFSTEQLEDELLSAIVQETVDHPVAAAAALAQIDAYFAQDGDEPEKQHRQSLFRLLGLLRPQLAELLCEPSPLPPLP